MTGTIKLSTSAAAFHALTLAADRKTRGGNKWAKVSKAGLVALLLDHGAVLRALKAEGVETQDAPAAATDTEEAEEEEGTISDEEYRRFEK